MFKPLKCTHKIQCRKYLINQRKLLTRIAWNWSRAKLSDRERASCSLTADCVQVTKIIAATHYWSQRISVFSIVLWLVPFSLTNHAWLQSNKLRSKVIAKLISFNSLSSFFTFHIHMTSVSLKRSQKKKIHSFSTSQCSNCKI